jgi:serine O-acetyltransferase
MMYQTMSFRSRFKQWLLRVSRDRTFGSFIRLYDQIREDHVVHYSEWDRPGFRALAVYRFGAMLKDKRGILWLPLSFLYRFMFRYIRNHYGIELPATTIVGRRFLIGHQHGIIIHPNAEFGDDCIIVQNVTIGNVALGRKNSGPKFGNRVEFGAGAVILGSITVGDDVRIGPNAVVITDIPAGSRVFVDPPRMMQMRKPQDNVTEPLKETSSRA